MSVGRNAEQWSLLTEYLGSRQRSVHAMNSCQLDGYLRAVVSSPVELPKDVWSALIFGEEESNISREPQRVQVALTNLYSFHDEQVKAGVCELPFRCAYTPSRDDRLDIEQWARGYMQGYILVEKEWNELLLLCPQATSSRYEDSEQQIDENLFALSTVADADYALSEGRSEKDVAAQFSGLVASIVSLAELGLMLRVWMQSNKPELQVRFAEKPEPVAVAPKVMRNEPCPCGSGRKYKKCCS